LRITSAGEGGNAPQLDTRAPQRELPAGVSAGRAGIDGVEAQLTVERGRAANYVYGARAARDFGDGFVAVLLPVYLAAIGLGALKIGLVATIALFGSGSMTLGIGRLGARLCQRKLLMAASALMVATALAFALSGAYAIECAACSMLKSPATSSRQRCGEGRSIPLALQRKR
jgi:MFS family permease